MTRTTYNSERCKWHESALDDLKERQNSLESRVTTLEKDIHFKLDQIAGKVSFMRGAALALLTVVTTVASIAGVVIAFLTMTGKL